MADCNGKFEVLFAKLNNLEQETYQNIKQRLDDTMQYINRIEYCYSEDVKHIDQDAQVNTEQFASLEYRITQISHISNNNVKLLEQQTHKIDNFDKNNNQRFLNLENQVKLLTQHVNTLLTQNTEIKCENNMLKEKIKKLQSHEITELVKDFKDLKIAINFDKLDTRNRLKNLSQEIEIKYEESQTKPELNYIMLAQLGNSVDTKFKKIEQELCQIKTQSSNFDQVKINTLEKQYQLLSEIANKNKIDINNFKPIVDSNDTQIKLMTLNKGDQLIKDKLIEVSKQIEKDQIIWIEINNNVKLLENKLLFFEQNQYKKNIELNNNLTNILQQLLITSNDLTEKQDRKITDLTDKTYKSLDFLEQNINKNIKINEELIIQNKVELTKIRDDFIQINKNNLDKEKIIETLELELTKIVGKVDWNIIVIESLSKTYHNYFTTLKSKVVKVEENLQVSHIKQQEKNLIFQSHYNEVLEQIKIVSQKSIEEIKENQTKNVKMIEALGSNCIKGQTFLDRIGEDIERLDKDFKKVNGSNVQTFLELEKEHKTLVIGMNDLKVSQEDIFQKQEKVEINMKELQNILSPFNLSNLINNGVENFVNRERRPKGLDFLNYLNKLVMNKLNCKYKKRYKNNSVHHDQFLNIESCLNIINFRNIVKEKKINLKLLELTDHGKSKVNLIKEAKFKRKKKQIKKHLISHNKAHSEIKPLIKREILLIKDESKNNKTNQFVREIAYITQHRKTPRLKPF